MRSMIGPSYPGAAMRLENADVHLMDGTGARAEAIAWRGETIVAAQPLEIAKPKVRSALGLSEVAEEREVCVGVEEDMVARIAGLAEWATREEAGGGDEHVAQLPQFATRSSFFGASPRRRFATSQARTAERRV